MIEPGQTPAHETADVSARKIWWFALSLAIGTFVIGAAVWWMMTALYHSGPVWPHHSPNTVPASQAPAPTLQIVPEKDLQELRAAEEKALQSYGWADRKAGVIRIPLDRAMDLIIQRGLPDTGTTMPLPGPQGTGNPGQMTLPRPPGSTLPPKGGAR